MDVELDVIYEDVHLLAVNKPCGEPVQPDPSGATSLSDRVNRYMASPPQPGRNASNGAGIVHRIDRPTSGVVLFARTHKALSRLGTALRQGAIQRIYWAVTEQAPAQTEAVLEHYLVTDSRSNKARVVEESGQGARLARLAYHIIGYGKRYVFLEVELLTGRHHQIRAQLAAIGAPVKGDLKYGARRSNPGGGISLHARALRFNHPVNGDPLDLVADPPQDPLWNACAQAAARHG